MFIKDFNLFLFQMEKKYLSVICGDININIMNISNIIKDYLNIMARNGYLPCTMYLVILPELQIILELVLIIYLSKTLILIKLILIY